MVHPAYFIMGGSIQMALVFTLYGIITNALGQIAYHRWLAHDPFVPKHCSQIRNDFWYYRMW